MQIKEIKAEYGSVMNLGDYNNVKLSAHAVATLEDGDDLDECYKELFGECKRQVEGRLNNIRKKRRSRTSQKA